MYRPVGLIFKVWVSGYLSDIIMLYDILCSEIKCFMYGSVLGFYFVMRFGSIHRGRLKIA